MQRVHSGRQANKSCAPWTGGRVPLGAMKQIEPKWLPWARELQALAQTGLAFTRDLYDQDRYKRLRQISAEIYSEYTGVPTQSIEDLFAGETGYATPKAGVRAAVFDEEDRILLVREVQDGGRWTLPGGWADVNLTPAENAVKEVAEESGYRVSITKLAAVWDNTRQKHPNATHSLYLMFFICDLEGGEPATSLETSEISWFREKEIPEDLSRTRVLPNQIARMFEHRRSPNLATDYDLID